MNKRQAYDEKAEAEKEVLACFIAPFKDHEWIKKVVHEIVYGKP